MTVIGMLHPGAMGSALAAQLLRAGHDVVWASEGRSADTVARADAVGLADVGTVSDLARAADVVMSVCPPHAAYDVATLVAGRVRVFVDANAISPATARRIASTVTAGGGTPVDGGVVGPPPDRERRTDLLLSGQHAHLVVPLFDGTQVTAKIVGSQIGDASATKMAYAAWTKGSAALILAARALARAEGVEDALLAEWQDTSPDAVARSASAAQAVAGKAWRWSGEMREIADTMAAAGLPSGFHEAAASVFDTLAADDGGGVDAVVSRLAGK